MIIEIMYKEFITYGEHATVEYLEKLLPEAEFIYTGYKDQPYFVKHHVDLIFFGPMSEHNMDLIYPKLLPYKDKLKRIIEDGQYFIGLNNSLDLFAKELEVKNGSPSQSLGIFDYKAIRNYDRRKSQLTVFDYKGKIVIGNQLGFSNYYGNEDNYILKAVYPKKGFNIETDKCGYRYKNAFLIELAGNVIMSSPFILEEIRNKFYGDTNIPYRQAVEYNYNENVRLMKVNKSAEEAIQAYTWE